MLEVFLVCSIIICVLKLLRNKQGNLKLPVLACSTLLITYKLQLFCSKPSHLEKSECNTISTRMVDSMQAKTAILLLVLINS